METEACRRHDISDVMWEKLSPYLTGQRGQHGGIAHDNRRFINGVLWILRTGAPWRDLPSCYGDWKNTHRRFTRWRDKGLWEDILTSIITNPDYEWLMIDSSYIKAHRDAAGAIGGSQAISRTKGGSTQRYIWPWMRMVCRSELLLQMVPAMILKKLRT